MSVENCPSCGAGIEEGVKFCPDCGTEVTSESAEKDTETASSRSFQEDERPVTEVIKQDEVKEYIKYTAGIFFSVGIGYGLALLLFDAFVDSGPLVGAAELVSIGMIMGILLSPLIASFSGVIVGLQLDESEKSVVSAAGVGSFVGFFVIVILTLLITSIISDGGGAGSGSTSDLVTDQLLSIIGFSIGVATAGGLSALATKRFLFE